MATRLETALLAVAPIDQVTVAWPGAVAVNIVFGPGATEAQQAAAWAVVANFDFNDDRAALNSAAQQAITDINNAITTDQTYLTIAATANASQVRDQVQALTNQNIKIMQALQKVIKRLIQIS